VGRRNGGLLPFSKLNCRSLFTIAGCDENVNAGHGIAGGSKLAGQLDGMKLIALLLASLLLTSAGCKKPNATPGVFSIVLKTLDRQTFSLSEIAENKASIFLFVQPECPFCLSYGKTFKQLDSVFNAQQVQLYAVVAGNNFPDSLINAYRQRFNFQFPVLLDPDFELTRQLNATITPQAFLLDANGRLLYHGMVDNWGYEIGKTRARATEFYLKEAVNAFLSGQTQPKDSTKAIGCYIQ
jgi:peroxiredoxin